MGESENLPVLIAMGTRSPIQQLQCRPAATEADKVGEDDIARVVRMIDNVSDRQSCL